jgi:uncharacterized membrane protein
VLQRLIGVSLGAVVTYLLLTLLNLGSNEANYGFAVVAGAIVSFVWPWFIAWYLVRRHRSRVNEQITKEVDRQVSEQTKQ